MLLSAAEIQGAAVTNLEEESIGEIDEVLIEPDSGQIRFAVVSVGRFLAMGSTRVAVPWTALKIERQEGEIRILLNATKERLEKAPRVEGKSYERLYPADISQPIYVYWDVDWLAPGGQ